MPLSIVDKPTHRWSVSLLEFYGAEGLTTATVQRGGCLFFSTGSPTVWKHVPVTESCLSLQPSGLEIFPLGNYLCEAIENWLFALSDHLSSAPAFKCGSAAQGWSDTDAGNTQICPGMRWCCVKPGKCVCSYMLRGLLSLSIAVMHTGPKNKLWNGDKLFSDVRNSLKCIRIWSIQFSNTWEF